MLIKRPKYLDQLIANKHNDLIKMILKPELMNL